MIVLDKYFLTGKTILSILIRKIKIFFDAELRKNPFLRFKHFILLIKMLFSVGRVLKLLYFYHIYLWKCKKLILFPSVYSKHNGKKFL